MLQLYDLDLSVVRPSLDLESGGVAEDAETRSPRTPIYRPTSPFSSSLSPFDHARLFSNLDAPLTPKTVESVGAALPPPPSDPLAWVWQCHLCRSRWPLGVTRRCLLDGHIYCSGETSQPNLKKKRKGRSCSSEFDYVGWSEWGAWKRGVAKRMLNLRKPSGCERCEFPSQCRYGAAEKEPIDEQPSNSPMTRVEYTSTMAEDDVARYYSNGNVTLPLVSAQAAVAGKSVQSEMMNIWQTDKRLTRSKSADNKAEERVAKIAERRLGTKPYLSPIEEEALTIEVGKGFQELVMPLVDFLAHHQEKRKSCP